MSGLTRFVLAHKHLVAVSWTVVALAGLVGSGRASEALETSVSMPESEAFATTQEIERQFGSGGTTPTLVAVVQLPEGRTPPANGFAAICWCSSIGAQRLRGARTASYGSSANRAFVSEDGRTTFVLVHPPVDAAGERDEFDPKVIAAAQEVVDSARRRRRAGRADGCSCARPDDERGERRHQRPRRDAARPCCLPRRPRLRVRLGTRARATRDGAGRDPDDAARALGARLAHGRPPTSSSSSSPSSGSDCRSTTPC